MHSGICLWFYVYAARCMRALGKVQRRLRLNKAESISARLLEEVPRSAIVLGAWDVLPAFPLLGSQRG